MLALHSSGMFSQFDLGDAIQPLDAIPHVASVWDASGALAFVANRIDRRIDVWDDSYVHDT
jgi:WD repeat-containing protein 24